MCEDFLDRLEEAIAVREKDLEAGALTAEGRQELSAMQQKLDSMKSNKKQRVKYAQKLVTKCGLRERTCEQTANLPFEEEKARLDTAWRLLDLLLSQAASPEPPDSLPVADPCDGPANRSQTAITMSDQIPVWLKPSPGRALTSVLRLSSSAMRPHANLEAEAEAPELFADRRVLVWCQPAAVW